MNPLSVIAFSLFCMLFGCLRFFLAGDAWGFLNHNLWLAWIPVLIAALIRFTPLPRWGVYGMAFVWLIFLPNAPYIVTDLIHMQRKTTLPWFDLLVLFHYAVAGLLAGSLSLTWVQTRFTEELGRLWAGVIIAGAIALSGFGMVIGRDLRIDSDELFTRPFEILGKIFASLQGETFLKCLLYGLTFASFHLLVRHMQRPVANGEVVANPDGLRSRGP